MIKYINKLLTISIIIFSVFYNIGAGIFLFFQKSPYFINFTSKLLGLFCSLVIILFLFNSKKIKINKFSIPLFLFLILYSIRLIFDVFFLNLNSGYPNLLIFSYFFGGTISVCFAILLSNKYINISYVLKYYIYFLCLSNVIIFILLIKLSQLNILTLFSQRLSFGINENETNDIINSITISVNAALLLIYFMFSSIFKFYLITIDKYIIRILILLCIINLILSGSRGPMISMVFIFILMLVQARKLNLFFFFRSTIFIIIFSFIFFEALNLKLNDLNYVQRIYSNDEITIFKDDNRKELYISAYLQFTKNPIFGDKYFEEITKTYPHNIFLEVLMSTGLVGILFFLLHIFNLVFLYFKNYNIKNNSTFLFYITFFYFSCSLFSSSIWGNLEFFIFSALLIYTLDYINLENA